MDWFGFVYAVITGTEVCYPPYGCYNNDSPFDRSLVLLPVAPSVIGTQFLLHTHKSYNNDPSKPQVIDPMDKESVTRSHFDSRKKTVLWIHGFIESSESWYVNEYYEKMLSKADMNVIFVDWSNGAKMPYNQAVGNARVVGAQVSRMIELLHNTTGLAYSNVHMIGFSLGAHVAGYAGRNIRRKGNLIGRITGLDPAAPYFQEHHIDVRLDKSDADFVDVIHTDTKTIKIAGFGTDQLSGHIDFYPNGGHYQPGCARIQLERSFDAEYWSCSHYRAVKFFLESISSTCGFIGVPCKSYKRFRKGKCNKHCKKGRCREMGYNAVKPKRPNGARYYLRTNSDPPYCQKL